MNSKLKVNVIGFVKCRKKYVHGTFIHFAI